MPTEETFNNMAAIATMANPLKVDNVLMWWNATDGNLKLKQRAFTDNADREYKKQIARGSMKNPSAVTTLVYQDMIWTFGVCNDTELRGGKLFALSPYVEPVLSADHEPPKLCEDTTYPGSLTGCSSNETAWLYFIDSSKTLVEFEFERGPTGTQFSIFPRVNSYLSAVYDPDLGGRYLVYQDMNSLQVVYNEAKSNEKIPGSEEARDGTAIATCYYNKRLFIYWINNSGNICRHSMPTGGKFTGPETRLTSQKKPTSFTQMSVTPSTTALNLYYLGTSGGKEKFIQYPDKDALKVT